MKSKKKTTKLEFNKETIARLGDDTLSNLKGGIVTVTRNANTCTCITYASMDGFCQE